MKSQVNRIVSAGLKNERRSSMSKANERASRLTLGSSHLDGYSGPVDVMTYRKRRWWHRLLLRDHVRRQRVYADVRGYRARAWRR
jgi:hypothetical protein